MENAEELMGAVERFGAAIDLDECEDFDSVLSSAIEAVIQKAVGGEYVITADIGRSRGRMYISVNKADLSELRKFAPLEPEPS